MPDIPNRDELEAKLARILARLQREQLARLLEYLGDPPRMDNVPQEYWDVVGRDLEAAIAPFLEQVYVDQAGQLMADLPIGMDWALINQGAVEWARRYTFELVKGINSTTRQALQSAVSAYFERGQTIGELERSLSGIYGPKRAEMIAVTEVTRAASEGEIAIGQDLHSQGVDMIATWNTNHDEKVCPICAPLHEKKAAGYEDDYRPYWIHPVTEKKYGPPPIHPRDRCNTNWELPKVRR